MFTLTVAILDTAFYALQAITSYLALDRRTRVVHATDRLNQLMAFLKNSSDAELPAVILIDADHVGGPAALGDVIRRLHDLAPEAIVVALAQGVDAALIEAAAKAGARGYFLKGDLRYQIGWAIIYSLEHDFVVTRSIHSGATELFNGRLFRATVLPEPRRYPELTERIRQAIRLCVVEGMPAQLAADEMGISPHTVRSYIKEGYRILEAYNDLEFPIDMTAQERAFYRFTMRRAGTAACSRGGWSPCNAM
jgi:DNA-binding NarL/FixJ family response regulator